jgi:hypothetical protein
MLLADICERKLMEGSATRPGDEGADPAHAPVRKIIHVDIDAGVMRPRIPAPT